MCAVGGYDYTEEEKRKGEERIITLTLHREMKDELSETNCKVVHQGEKKN